MGRDPLLLHCWVFEGSLAGMINITKPGDNTQLFQAGIILEPVTIYRLAFTAYSTSAHGFTVGLLNNAPTRA